MFGPSVEPRLGAWRFALLYLGAGLGSMAGVTALTLGGVIAPDLLVGAWRAIMGLLGGLVALMLRQPGPDRVATRAGLRLLLLLLALQSGIDLAVPHISMAGHLCSAASGFLIGAVLPLPRDGARLRRLLAPAPAGLRRSDAGAG